MCVCRCSPSVCGTGARLGEKNCLGVSRQCRLVCIAFLLCPESVCCYDRCGSDVKRSIYGRVGDFGGDAAAWPLTAALLFLRSGISSTERFSVSSSRIMREREVRPTPRTPRAGRKFATFLTQVGQNWFQPAHSKKTALFKVGAELSPHFKPVRWHGKCL